MFRCNVLWKFCCVSTLNIECSIFSNNRTNKNSSVKIEIFAVLALLEITQRGFVFIGRCDTKFIPTWPNKINKMILSTFVWGARPCMNSIINFRANCSGTFAPILQINSVSKLTHLAEKVFFITNFVHFLFIILFEGYYMRAQHWDKKPEIWSFGIFNFLLFDVADGQILPRSWYG